MGARAALAPFREAIEAAERERARIAAMRALWARHGPDGRELPRD